MVRPSAWIDWRRVNNAEGAGVSSSQSTRSSKAFKDSLAACKCLSAINTVCSKSCNDWRWKTGTNAIGWSLCQTGARQQRCEIRNETGKDGGQYRNSSWAKTECEWSFQLSVHAHGRGDITEHWNRHVWFPLKWIHKLARIENSWPFVLQSLTCDNELSCRYTPWESTYHNSR